MSTVWLCALDSSKETYAEPEKLLSQWGTETLIAANCRTHCTHFKSLGPWRRMPTAADVSVWMWYGRLDSIPVQDTGIWSYAILHSTFSLRVLLGWVRMATRWRLTDTPPLTKPRSREVFVYQWNKSTVYYILWTITDDTSRYDTRTNIYGTFPECLIWIALLPQLKVATRSHSLRGISMSLYDHGTLSAVTP